MGIDAKMFSRYRGSKPTPDQLKLWSWDLCRAVGAINFFIQPDEGRAALHLSPAYDAETGENDPARAGREWHQDGDTLHAEEGEWFVGASLYTRYYGEGYERGNWPVLIHTAEWMEHFIGPVWYGGDSSGVCASPFGEAERRAMVKHALSTEGRAYFGGFERNAFKTPPPCALCVKDRGHTRHGWGAGYIRTACAGCGRSFVTHDDGKTWKDVTKEDK